MKHSTAHKIWHSRLHGVRAHLQSSSGMCSRTALLVRCISKVLFNMSGRKQCYRGGMCLRCHGHSLCSPAICDTRTSYAMYLCMIQARVGAHCDGTLIAKLVRLSHCTCCAGDFDSRQVVSTIEKYLGQWKPDPSQPDHPPAVPLTPLPPQDTSG